MGCKIAWPSKAQNIVNEQNHKNKQQQHCQPQKQQKSNNVNKEQQKYSNTEIKKESEQNKNNKKAQKQRNQSNEINQKVIGVPHIENEYWQMVRNGKTKSLTKAFQDQLINCDEVIVTASGHTIVHESIILDKREYFKLCEVYGADWNKADVNGVTPLMKAVALNRVFYVQRLLQLGASMDARDNKGRSALQYGLMYESYDAVDKLKEAQNQ